MEERKERKIKGGKKEWEAHVRCFTIVFTGSIVFVHVSGDLQP
jgi:hypothetical protein